MGDWQGEQNWSNYNQQDWNQGQVCLQGAFHGFGGGLSLSVPLRLKYKLVTEN